ncbi:MAG: hypothetical protein OEY29_07915 [Gammaproteobacteria bacterium]|nr:hypothetical protein [Gammaproteobacteria bacterium]
MNKHVPSDPHDDKISSLYQQGSVETPAAHINENIRLHARKHSASVISFPLRRVLNVISSSRSLQVAAVLVIGVSIILQIQFDHPAEMSRPEPAEYSVNDLLADKSDAEHGVVTEDQLLTPSVSSDSVQESLAERNLNPVARPASPRPAMKAKAAPEKPAADDEMQQTEKSETMMREKRRLTKQFSEEKQAHSSHRQAELILHSTATSMQSVSEQDADDLCRTLDNAACLNSATCVLNNISNDLVCRPALNHCEQDFSQLQDHPDLCQQKPHCEYTASDCNCHSDGSCSCLGDTPPACKLTAGEDK